MNKGKYKSQALLDERALLTCMAYVDLNPIRAGMAKSLEESDYTSIQSRIEKTGGKSIPLPLVPFEDELETDQTALPYYLRHYLELVDWTGRAITGATRCRKDILPTKFPGCAGIFPGQRVRQPDLAKALLDVLVMDGAHSQQLFFQGLDRKIRQNCASVFIALPTAYDQATLLTIQILNSQPQTFHQA